MNFYWREQIRFQSFLRQNKKLELFTHMSTKTLENKIIFDLHLTQFEAVLYAVPVGIKSQTFGGNVTKAV